MVRVCLSTGQVGCLDIHWVMQALQKTCSHSGACKTRDIFTSGAQQHYCYQAILQRRKGPRNSLAKGPPAPRNKWGRPAPRRPRPETGGSRNPSLLHQRLHYQEIIAKKADLHQKQAPLANSYHFLWQMLGFLF